MVVAGMAEAVTQAAMAVRVVTLVAALISVTDTLADMAAISGTAVSGPMGSARVGSRPPTDMFGSATKSTPHSPHPSLRLRPCAGLMYGLARGVGLASAPRNSR
jgi:hypothetical protein